MNVRALRGYPSRGDPRIGFAGILTFYVVLGVTVLGFNRSPGQILMTVGAAALLDVAMHRLLRGGWLFPLSACITGLSLSILLNYAHGPWLPLVPVFLAVVSKYLFTFQGRHVFNPSLFGVVASLALGGGMISAAPAYQWGGTPLMAAFVVTAALALFVFRIRRNALILAFLGFYFAALALRAWMTRWHVPPETLFAGALTSPAFYLFCFFMITDPATSPSTRRGQVLMALFIVVVDLVLHKFESLSTLFYAGFAYFALRWALLHARALWTDRGDHLRGAGATLRAWGLGTVVAAGGLTVHAAILAPETALSPGLRLAEIPAARAGISARPGDVLELVDPRLAHVAKWILSTGDAVAVADADADGLPDLFLTFPLKDGRDRAALYRNLGGFRFERVRVPALERLAADPRTHGLPSGALWFDHDNDGDRDLFVHMGFGRPRLLRNTLAEDGHLAFTEVEHAFGTDLYTVGIAANVLDMDRDGHLDLLVANAMSPLLPGYDTATRFNVFALPEPAYPGDRRMLNVMHRTWHDARNGGENLFFRGGPGGFARAQTGGLGLSGTRWTMAVGAGDLNGDGWPDLYLANDFGPDELLLNRRGERFEPVRGRLVGTLGRDTYKGMNASLGDVDGNGFADVYVSNVHEPLQAEGSLLWMNRGNAGEAGPAAFRDEAAGRNALNERRFGWGAAMGDLDLDGRLDIVQANGMVDDAYDRRHDECPDYWYWNAKIALTGPEVHGYADRWADLRGRCIFPYEPNRVMLNRGRHFVDVAADVGLGRADNARGVALADLDNDGDLDVLLTHQFAPVSIYRNDAPARGWLGLSLAGNGTSCNRDAVGTRVEVRHGTGATARRQVREVYGANGFSAQGDQRLLFGLGEHRGPVAVDVYWCGAAVPERHTVAAGRYVRLVQGRRDGA